MKISILYYYYAKWAKIDKKILDDIKEGVLYYYNLGYKNKIINLFLKHPKIFGFIVRIKKGNK